MLGTVHPIRGGGEDAAGIAGSLAAGVQAPERGLAGPMLLEVFTDKEKDTTLLREYYHGLKNKNE